VNEFGVYDYAAEIHEARQEYWRTLPVCGQNCRCRTCLDDARDEVDR
jgi:hypothetical protein